MTNYRRVGNRTFRERDLKFMTPQQIEKIKTDGEKANERRLENMRRGLGIKPEAITLDVTPAGIAKRQAAIKAEEARIAAETASIEKDLGAETAGFVGENETPAAPTAPEPAKKGRLTKGTKKLPNTVA